MVKQYPYQLWVQVFEESTQNSEGDFTETETTWNQVSTCRDEANQSGQVIRLVDSTEIKYDFLIQLPKSCPPIATGTPVQVRDGSAVRVFGEVKRFSTDQLHCRLWV